MVNLNRDYLYTVVQFLGDRRKGSAFGSHIQQIAQVQMKRSVEQRLRKGCRGQVKIDTQLSHPS
jgi:hypothetical protein